MNLRAVIPLADSGEHIEFIKPVPKAGVRTADMKMRNLLWEIKTIKAFTSLETAVDTQLKKSKGQSNNIILGVFKQVDISELKACINKRFFLSASFNRIIISNNGNWQEFTRAEVLDWYNDEQIRCFVDRMRNKNK